MSAMINVSAEIKDRLKNHLQEGEVLEDVIVKLLDLDDQYEIPELMEFEVVFNEDIIKVFRLHKSQIEYFTPARKFSISLSDWNLPDEFRNDWIMFATSDDIVSVLFSLGEGILECGNFQVRQI